MVSKEDSILIIDAAFGKINDKLSTIFQNEDNRHKYARRWIWELIQNARDSQKTGVNISVFFDESMRRVSFSHDGKCFDRLSLLRLITQISDKIEGEDNTGRFGTGFITTNLISKTIYIAGAYIKEDGTNIEFNFTLDRSAWSADKKTNEFVFELKQQIQAAIIDLDILENSRNCLTSNKLTCFSYPIVDDDALKSVKIGIQDLDRQLPLVMAFNPSINSLKVNTDVFHCRSASEENITSDIKLSRFLIVKNQKFFKSLLVFTDVKRKSQIAFYATDKQLEGYPDETPRLFCRFPMVGTESFGLPIVFNSELFEVTETRDTIRDDHPINIQLLDNALELYQFALDYFIQQGYSNYQHICKVHNYGNSSLSRTYANKVKNFYSVKPIVKTIRGKMNSLKTVSIPFIRQDEFQKDEPTEGKEKLLKMFYDLVADCPNIEVPVYSDFNEWSHIYPESRIAVDELGAMICNGQNLLSTMQQSWLSWLNEYIRLMTLLNKKEFLRDSKIYVNQDNKIVSLKGNYRDGIQNETLKEIFNLVFKLEEKEQLKNKLILKELNLDHAIFNELLTCENDKTIAVKIAQKVAEEQALAKSKGKLESTMQKAFYELFYWMNSNEELAATLFPATFNDRMSLCSPSEQIEHYNFGVQTKQALAKYDVSTVDDLVQKIESRVASYADICLAEIQNDTASILSGNPEEIDESAIIRLLQQNAIQNEQELIRLLQASRYSAESIQSFLQYRRSSLEEAYKIVKKMLEDAAQLIFGHLRKKPNIYNLAKANKIAPTVYDGITKYGEEICIIARPSNNSKVILYYESEPDYLRKNYELWIVDTNNAEVTPRVLTFGDMIKITGIRVIPLRNLFN